MRLAGSRIRPTRKPASQGCARRIAAARPEAWGRMRARVRNTHPTSSAPSGAPVRLSWPVGPTCLTSSLAAPFPSHIGRGLRFAASGVSTGRLGSIGMGSPAGEDGNVPPACAGRDFVVGPGPTISFPFYPCLRAGPPLFAPPRRPNQRARLEGRPASPPSVAVDPKPGMTAKLRDNISVKNHAFGARALVPSEL
jgi:hypothetical protein